jgi:dynein light chain Tctex-type 1
MEDDAGFDEEVIEKCLSDTLELVLSNETWEEKRAPHLINEICEKTMKSLAELQRPYKYIVTCMLMQKTGAGVQSTYSCSWENNSDGLKWITFPHLRAKDNAQRTI